MKNEKVKTFLGHPLGLRTLFMTEFWERFSYYGMRAILLYYMYDAMANGGLGIDKATAGSIMAIYGSMVYLTSVIGGFVSDRILGSRRTVFWGGIAIMIGHIILSMPLGFAGLLWSIAFIIIGTGLLKPNVSNMVGHLYGENDSRRDSGFSIFVMGINLGSFIAPLVVGAMKGAYGYHAGFSLAAIGMAVGLIFYVIDSKKQFNKEDDKAPDPILKAELKNIVVRVVIALVVVVVIIVLMAVTNTLTIDNIVAGLSIIAIVIPIFYFAQMLTSPKTNKDDRSRVLAYIPLFIAAVAFWAIEESSSVVLAFFAKDNTRILHIFGYTVDPSQYQSLNPLFIIFLSPIFAWLWIKLGKKQPSSPMKFVIGLIFTAASYMIMAVPMIGRSEDVRVSGLWLVASFFLVVIGEMLVSPVGLSVTTKLAPRAFSSQMMGMWFLADAVAQAINSQIIRFYHEGNIANYFIYGGIIALVLSLIMFMLKGRISRLMAGVK